jgi:poly-gamma-glutamate capsule biosynthesis protein CapA/YwtB (metallophosphatase superfamily)
MGRKTVRPKVHHDSGKRQTRENTILVASDWAPIRAFDPLVKRDPEAVYGDMLPVLRAADLRIVNCECALTSYDKPVWKSGATFKGEPEHVRGLTVVPFEVVCLANNHVFDYGIRGFRESLNILHQNGIKTVGAGLTEEQAFEPFTILLDKSKVSIMNISEGEDLTAARGGPGVYGWDTDRARFQVQRGKKSGACVIVIAHCGLEYVPYPPNYIVSAFRGLVDAGADCVIGHHPHVPQGIEWYRGRPIAYSLGNFVFYQHTDLYYRKIGFCVGIRIAGKVVTGIDVYPYRITESGVCRLEMGEEQQFRRKLSKISRPLKTPGGAAKAWCAYLAYYGMGGFSAEVLTILERMRSEPEKGAAMFRNRITTPQHYELWRDLLTRIMAGEKAQYSREAYRIVQEWFTRTI